MSSAISCQLKNCVISMGEHTNLLISTLAYIDVADLAHLLAVTHASPTHLLVFV